MNNKENFLTSTPVVSRRSNERPINGESPITARINRAPRRIDFSSSTLPASQISINGLAIDNTTLNEESVNVKYVTNLFGTKVDLKITYLNLKIVKLFTVII